MSDFSNLRTVWVPKDATVITQCSDGLTRVLGADGEWHEAVEVHVDPRAAKVAAAAQEYVKITQSRAPVEAELVRAVAALIGVKEFAVVV